MDELWHNAEAILAVSQCAVDLHLQDVGAIPLEADNGENPGQSTPTQPLQHASNRKQVRSTGTTRRFKPQERCP